MRARNLGPIALMPLLTVLAGPAAAQTPLELRPGDQVLLQVKNEPGLSGRYTVGPDGSMMLPLLGLVAAAERPFRDVAALVRAGFAGELADPEIHMTPLQRVSVLGEVRLPGYQWVDTTATVTDLLVLAGGFLPTANRNRITLTRGVEDMRVSIEGGEAAPAMGLRSGDRLFVGRRSWLAENLPIFIGAAASVAAAAVTSLIVR